MAKINFKCFRCGKRFSNPPQLADHYHDYPKHKASKKEEVVRRRERGIAYRKRAKRQGTRKTKKTVTMLPTTNVVRNRMKPKARTWHYCPGCGLELQ